MRPDMAKVVTESPRSGHSARSEKWGGRLTKDEVLRACETDDAGPSGLIAWSRRRNFDCKQFSDLLGPLRKYLRKQAGRHWDDVYSELSQTLDKRSLTGIHIWDHIRSEVDIHTYMTVRGEVWTRGRFGSVYPVGDLFVHPYTRLLCYTPGDGRSRYARYYDAVGRKPQPKPLKPIKINDTTELVNLKGLWFEVRYGYVDVYVSERRSPSGYIYEAAHFVTERRQVVKRQLSRKELRKHGLKNGAEVVVEKDPHAPRVIVR